MGKRINHRAIAVAWMAGDGAPVRALIAGGRDADLAEVLLALAKLRGMSPQEMAGRVLAAGRDLGDQG